MSSPSWKHLERRLARLIGGRRNPLSGADPATGSRGDLLHPYIFGECKYRKRHSAVALWDHTKSKADAEHKIPLVCLGVHGRRGFWLVLHSDDFARLSEAETSGLPLFEQERRDA